MSVGPPPASILEQSPLTRHWGVIAPALSAPPSLGGGVRQTPSRQVPPAAQDVPATLRGCLVLVSTKVVALAQSTWLSIPGVYSGSRDESMFSEAQCPSMQLCPIPQSVIASHADTMPRRANRVFSGTRLSTADRTTSVAPWLSVAVSKARNRSAVPPAE